MFVKFLDSAADGATFFSTNLLFVILVSVVPFGHSSHWVLVELVGFAIALSGLCVLFTAAIECTPRILARHGYCISDEGKNAEGDNRDTQVDEDENRTKSNVDEELPEVTMDQLDDDELRTTQEATPYSKCLLIRLRIGLFQVALRVSQTMAQSLFPESSEKTIEIVSTWCESP